jgi:UDP-N-acetylmuramate dehydrogenase
MNIIDSTNMIGSMNMKRSMDLNKFETAELIKKIPGVSVAVDEPMSGHTSFRIGGPADVFARPADIAGLSEILRICRENKVPAMIMGNGTNLIVRDKGIRGVVIQLTDNMCKYEVKGEEIFADAGVLISRLSKAAFEHGLTGLEFAEGIPGTLGGAVTMNAGAYDGDMSMVVKCTDYLGDDGQIHTIDNEQHCFGKRSSIIQSNGGVVLRSVISLKKGDRDMIKEKMDDYHARRCDKQPLNLPSAGSIFKRPEGHFAGKLVQDCGLKGYRIGGAEVSCLHCGFIVNAGDAAAQDVISLIRHIQDTVHDKYGVELQTEVKIVGEE